MVECSLCNKEFKKKSIWNLTCPKCKDKYIICDDCIKRNKTLFEAFQFCVPCLTCAKKSVDELLSKYLKL